MGSSPIPATRPVGQAAKTPPFHGGNGSSILLRVTKRNKSELFRKSKLVRICFLLLNSHIDAVSERGQATSLCSFLRLLSVLSMERQKGKIELFRGQFTKPTTLSLEHEHFRNVVLEYAKKYSIV